MFTTNFYETDVSLQATQHKGLPYKSILKPWQTFPRPECIRKVCFMKIRSKYTSNNTLLSLLRIFMEQTLGVVPNLANDVFRFGQNAWFWLLQLREDLITLIILHQLNKYLQNSKLSKFRIIILRLLQEAMFEPLNDQLLVGSK